MVDFVVNATVTISDVAQENARVILRNENSGDSQSLNTNASGKVMFSGNNFTSGWKVGEILTLAVIYTSYEAESSHTIVVGEGGWTQALALTAVIVSDLNYCTIQDVSDYINIDLTETNPVFTAEQLRKIGLRIEDQIERRCNTVFHDNNGDYTTITTEYHDVRNAYQRYFFLRKRPVIAFTKIELNVADDSNATGSWTDVTTDCKTDTDTGRVDIIATGVDGPTTGTKMFRATYTIGFAAVPEEIRQLTVLMIVRELIRSAVGKGLMEGKDNFRPTELTVMDGQIEEIFGRWTQHNLVNV